MKRFLILLASLFLVGIAHAETRLEKDCRYVFEKHHLWRFGDPNDSQRWDQRCWDYVVKSGNKWKWVGDAETRRIAEEQSKLAKEKKKKEQIKKQLEIARRARLVEEKHRDMLINHKTLPFKDVERFLSEKEFSPEIEVTPLVDFYVGYLFEMHVVQTGNPLDALIKTVERARDQRINLLGLSKKPISLFLVHSANLSPSQEEGSTIQINSGWMPSVFKPVLSTLDEARQVILHTYDGFALLMHVGGVVVDRDVVNRQSISSTYQSGTRQESNPDYNRAIIEMNQALNEYNNFLFQNSCSQAGTWDAFACGFHESSLKHKYYDAGDRVSSTPQTVSRPVYSSYEFQKNVVKVEKTGVIEMYLFDNNSELVVKGTTDLNESRSFTLVYDLHKKDRNLSLHKKQAATEADVVSFQNKTMVITLNRVLREVDSRKPERNETVFAKDILIQLGNNVTKTIEEQERLTHVTGLSDRRFLSVVIVLHPNGGIGTGFYIDEETVLTNYHVVEGSQFHEIGLFDGSDTFGKVYAKNIALDLALIKVQKRGIPVKLYGSNKLAVGATVDAIGHPQGLEYSLTRGTISGIRRMPSLYDPGGKPVRFIQSDVAINPGNSGGPLFLGDEVIGVNDWKLAATDLEGLSFSIHISEVRKFLEKHGF